MSRYMRFESSATLQSFIRERAISWPSWRDTRVWLDRLSSSLTLEAPNAEQVAQVRGATPVDGPPAGASIMHGKLGDLWKSARPVPRDQSGSDIPQSCLFLLRGQDEAACDQFLEFATSGLDVLELQDSAASPTRYHACLLRGEAARMLAHSPPAGCEAFECDEIPGVGLAALTPGWRVPRMLEELWPQDSGCLLMYRRSASGDFGLQILREVARRPLTDFLRGELRPDKGLADPMRNLRKSPWRVLHRPAVPADELRDLDDSEVRNVVFRIKTFDLGARTSVLDAATGHDLGHSLLQVLDECEAGLLPSIRYSAFDKSEHERWHFLHAEQADNRLLEAWRMLDRFEHVPELAAYGMDVFVSRASRMVPPVSALLDSTATRDGILKRIHNLLGSPEKGSMVLIEDLETAGADSQSAWESRSINPRIVHLNADSSLPLSELIPRLVGNWNNAEPIRAKADLAEPSYIGELRESHEQRLRSIAAQEEDALLRAANAAQQALEEWATRARAAVEQAAVPVREARGVCTLLESALASSAASIQQTCQHLERFCKALTGPRRAWLGEQVSQHARALAEAAPRIAEADAVRQRAETMRSELETQMSTLQRAIEALEALDPQLRDRQRNADTVLAAAAGARTRVEQLAAAAIRQVETQLQEAAREAERATARRAEVRQRQTQLQSERDRVAETERETSRLLAENRTLEEEIQRRIASTRSQREETERIRDIEIPRLAREATESQSQLTALNPPVVQEQLRDATAVLERIRAEVRVTTAEIDRTKQLRADAAAESVVIGERQSELQSEIAEYEAARSSLDDARRALEKGIADFRAGNEQEGDAKWVRDRIRQAEQALSDLGAPKPTGFWSQLFGRGGA